MTKMELAIAKLQMMPVARRELMLDVILGWDENPEFTLSDEQLADLEESIKEADAGDFATDAEVEAVWKKLGL
jgi:hypothetical protein